MYLLKKNIHTTTMKTNIRFTFLIVKLIPFALLSQLRSLASSESNMASFFTSSLHPLEYIQCGFRFQILLYNNFTSSLHPLEYIQFGFIFQILLTTSVRFSTKTLAYLAHKAYKAYKAFKRSRLNPFQNYRSITSFSVDWPRTIRLVYTSVSILSVCAIIL